MPTLKEQLLEDKQALNWAITQPKTPQRDKVLNSIGLDDEDLIAYHWSEQNKDHPKATEIKNQVISKIADVMPVIQEQGVSTKERLTVKNILDTAGPDVQAKYLQDNGYLTRMKDNQLQVRKPDQTIWSVVDPKELDLGDVLDHIGDAIEIGAGVAATVPAGFMGGAAVAGAVEAGKQALGRAMGVRELSAGELVKQTALGGIGAKAGQLIGVGAKKAYESGLDFLSSAVPKANMAEVEKAAKALGIDKLFPTQKVESKLAQRLTTEQLEGGLLGGYQMRALQRIAKEKTSEEAQKLVAEGISKTPYQIGEAMGQQIQQAVAKKLEPAVKIYDQLATNFKFIPVKKDAIASAVENLKKDFKLSGTSGDLKNIVKDFGTIRTLDDLKAVRTSLIRRKSPMMSPEQSDLYDSAYEALTNLRSDVLKTKFPDQKAAIEKADKLFAETADDIKNLFGLKKLRGTVSGATEKMLEDIPKEKLLDRVFKTENFAQLQELQKRFPNIYEDARKFKIGQIAEEATTKDGLTPKSLIRQVDKLNPEVKQILFGQDGAQKAEYLKTYLNSLPENMNISGTTTQKMTLGVLNPLTQAAAIGRSVLLDLITNNAFKVPGKQGNITKGLIGGGILGSQVIRRKD